MLNRYRKATNPVHSINNIYFWKKENIFLDSEGLIWTDRAQNIPVKTGYFVYDIS